jgi:DeoR/GlpR family transcriptional regulator of sugar metabolism
MRFDKCFITSTSISAEFGLSIKSSDCIDFINAIINSSKKTIGLYTTEKIGYESIISICPSNKLDILITNWDAPYDELKKFDEQGIEVIVTDKPQIV